MSTSSSKKYAFKLNSVIREPRDFTASSILKRKLFDRQIDDLLCLFMENNNSGLPFQMIAEEFGLPYDIIGHSKMATIFQRMATKEGIAIYTYRNTSIDKRPRYYLDEFTSAELNIQIKPEDCKIHAASRRGIRHRPSISKIKLTKKDEYSNYPKNRGKNRSKNTKQNTKENKNQNEEEEEEVPFFCLPEEYSKSDINSEEPDEPIFYFAPTD